MKTTKLMAAVAAMALVAQSGVAAVRPSSARLLPAAMSQTKAGVRIGTAKGKRSDVLQGAALALVVVAAGGAAAGAAAAAGAFDGNNNDTVSP